MADYSKLAFSTVRSLLWTELKSTGVLTENDYWVESFNDYINPVIPSQQVPEFQNLLPAVPYIVYDIETMMYSSEYWICEEEVTFTVISNDYGKVFEILELIKDIFRRYDQTAQDLNILNPEPFKFLDVYLTGLMSPEYGEDEGGQVVGVARVSYRYVRDIEPSGRFS